MPTGSNVNMRSSCLVVVLLLVGTIFRVSAQDIKQPKPADLQSKDTPQLADAEPPKRTAGSADAADKQKGPGSDQRLASKDPEDSDRQAAEDGGKPLADLLQALDILKNAGRQETRAGSKTSEMEDTIESIRESAVNLGHLSTDLYDNSQRRGSRRNRINGGSDSAGVSTRSGRDKDNIFDEFTDAIEDIDLGPIIAGIVASLRALPPTPFTPILIALTYELDTIIELIKTALELVAKGAPRRGKAKADVKVFKFNGILEAVVSVLTALGQILLGPVIPGIGGPGGPGGPGGGSGAAGGLIELVKLALELMEQLIDLP